MLFPPPRPPTACRPVARSFPPPGAPLRAASWEWLSLSVRVPSDSVRCRLQYPFVSAETLFTAASKPKAQNRARRSFQLRRLTTGKPMTTCGDRRRLSHVVVVCLAVKTAGFGVQGSERLGLPHGFLLERSGTNDKSPPSAACRPNGRWKTGQELDQVLAEGSRSCHHPESWGSTGQF